MSNLQNPFFDPKKSYEENYHKGPFGSFADSTIYKDSGEPTFEVFGYKVYLPFGIPAGPLLNSKYVKAALDKGFDIAVYKTVRSREYPCNQFPNVLSVEIPGDLTLEQADKGVVGNDNYKDPLTITNSFGVPSFPPEVWQQDMADVVSYSEKVKGKLVIGSFQGTTNSTGDATQYIQDFVKTAKMVKETQVKVLEVNLSCPNEGTAHLLCFDTPRVKEIVYAIKNEIGNTPLSIKVAYYKDRKQLKTLVTEIGKMVQGISAINTIPAKIYKNEEFTEQALPGNNRLISGTCGHGIKWAGLEMVSKLKELRSELDLSFEIEGVGGVTKSQDYFDYMEVGADSVMSATGAMWNPLLAQQIKAKVLQNG